MAFPVIISFYTEGTPYEKEVENLQKSCDKFQLECVIKGVKSFGSWELNCAYKPFFIREQLRSLKRPLLWVDADGVFVKKPTWQREFESDLSVRLHLDLPNDHPSKVISSTVFVNPTEQGHRIVRKWIEQCQEILLDPNRKEEFWDQIALRNAITSCFESCKIAPLPISYSKIFDHPKDSFEVHSPVIEHYQASRRFKHSV